MNTTTSASVTTTTPTFNSGSITLTYDNNGNMTSDGVMNFIYDAWNRLVKATRIPDAQTDVGQTPAV